MIDVVEGEQDRLDRVELWGEVRVLDDGGPHPTHDLVTDDGLNLGERVEPALNGNQVVGSQIVGGEPVFLDETVAHGGDEFERVERGTYVRRANGRVGVGAMELHDAQRRRTSSARKRQIPRVSGTRLPIWPQVGIRD